MRCSSCWKRKRLRIFRRLGLGEFLFFFQLSLGLMIELLILAIGLAGVLPDLIGAANDLNNGDLSLYSLS
jgi:hypothetical protein